MIRLENIRKAFGRTVAVDGLSLHIQPGEVFGLLGPNGAGKTTTIAMCTGLLSPDAGTVTIGGPEGGNPCSPRVRRLIGVAPQTLGVYDGLSGRENLRFFGSLYGLSAPECNRRVDEALHLVGLLDRQHDRVAGYSGGMKRRINLAAAILHDPRAVFMDEPTAGVDPQSRNAIFDIVHALKARGTTVVYSTHYMEEAERMCDRVGIIDRGRVLAVGPVTQLLKDHGGLSVLELVRDHGGVEKLETADPVHALAAAVNAGGVQSARIHAPDLESVFLHLTGRTLRD